VNFRLDCSLEDHECKLRKIAYAGMYAYSAECETSTIGAERLNFRASIQASILYS
jgi:hypothetical protein